MEYYSAIKKNAFESKKNKKINKTITTTATILDLTVWLSFYPMRAYLASMKILTMEGCRLPM